MEIYITLIYKATHNSENDQDNISCSMTEFWDRYCVCTEIPSFSIGAVSLLSWSHSEQVFDFLFNHMSSPNVLYL